MFSMAFSTRQMKVNTPRITKAARTAATNGPT
jgi:hypothetical protein